MTRSSVKQWFIFSILTSYQPQDLSPSFPSAEFPSGQHQLQRKRQKCLKRNKLQHLPLGESLHQNNASEEISSTPIICDEHNPRQVCFQFKKSHKLDCWYFLHHFSSSPECFFSSFSMPFLMFLTVSVSTLNLPGPLTSPFSLKCLMIEKASRINRNSVHRS